MCGSFQNHGNGVRAWEKTKKTITGPKKVKCKNQKNGQLSSANAKKK